MNCDLNSSIPDWIIEYPETAKVFDQLGLDSSCGGKSLEYLCFQQNLNSASVLQQLEAVIRNQQQSQNGEANHDS